jgi:hypothetical protein
VIYWQPRDRNLTANQGFSTHRDFTRVSSSRKMVSSAPGPAIAPRGQALCWPIGRQFRFQRHGDTNTVSAAIGGIVGMRATGRITHDATTRGRTRLAYGSSKPKPSARAPLRMESDRGRLPTLSSVILSRSGLVVTDYLPSGGPSHQSLADCMLFLFCSINLGLAFRSEWPNFKIIVV